MSITIIVTWQTKDIDNFNTLQINVMCLNHIISKL